MTRVSINDLNLSDCANINSLYEPDRVTFRTQSDLSRIRRPLLIPRFWAQSNQYTPKLNWKIEYWLIAFSAVQFKFKGFVVNLLSSSYVICSYLELC